MSSSSTASVCESLHALLHGVIDYAGMYPPARLPLAAAWRNYREYRQSDDAWMLAHFVVSAADLESLSAIAGDLPATEATPSASVVGRPATTEAEWFAQWNQDNLSVASFLKKTAGKVAVAALEVKLPDDIVAANDSAGTTAFAMKAVAETGSAALFLELPVDSKTLIDQHVAGLAAAAMQTKAKLGLKLRTGGLQAAAFPTLAKVAEVIDACRRHGLSWKATAGLHHPMRQHRAEVDAPMHGFINVLSAMVLAAVHSLPTDRLVKILADETPDHFRFDNAGLTWNGLKASVSQVQSARRSGMISFGSCSFDEPRDDLRALGWLTS